MYCVAIMLNYLNVCVFCLIIILVIGFYYFVSKHFIGAVCGVALVLATMTMGGATFHPTYTLKSLHNEYILNFENVHLCNIVFPC